VEYGPKHVADIFGVGTIKVGFNVCQRDALLFPLIALFSSLKKIILR
jgi:hypothetical protein